MSERPDVGSIRTMSGDEWAAYHADQRRRSDATLVTGDDSAAMTTPTPLREALATPVDWEEFRKEQGWPTPNHMRRTADAIDTLTPAKYGDVLRWVADACDAALYLSPDEPMQAVAEHVAVGRAVARLLEATKDEAGLALLHVPAGTRPDGRVIATEEGWTVERWASVWGHVTSNGATLPEAIVAALGPPEGERT